jgi:hypothetical protein
VCSCVHLSSGQLRKRRTCPRWRAERTPIPFAAGEARANHAGRRRRARVGVRRGAAGTRMGSAAHTGVRRCSVARDHRTSHFFHPWAATPTTIAFHSNRASYSGIGDILDSACLGLVVVYIQSLYTWVQMSKISLSSTHQTTGA